MEIHQLLSGMHPGDAISNHALALRGRLRSWGHDSEIYSVDISKSLIHDCRDYHEFHPRSDVLTIYHYALGSEELTRLFVQNPGKRVLIYHNITPHHYVEKYNKDLGVACREGRAALAELREATDLAVGDSEFNCRELAEHGFHAPRVLPLLIDFQESEATLPCPKIMRRLDDTWANFLFVGRVSPHKCQQDVVRVFAHYNCRIDRRSRLLIVGGWRHMDGYVSELKAIARSLGIEDHVFFTGHVRPNELAAYYRAADVFLCMSEHEGVCVPLLEAMAYHVPVIAYAAAAVPETLGEAGVLVTRKEHGLIAELAHLLISDKELRKRVVRRQRRRLADFQPEPIVERFRSIIEEVLPA
jgi:glycosyltransferase involved in cell wall biosynthesis